MDSYVTRRVPSSHTGRIVALESVTQSIFMGVFQVAVGWIYDLSGAAAVIGTISALAKNKVKQNVIAVVAACENAISGGSYKPGDIIGSMAGKTIEVLNTDAEGRLTLADAVTYIVRKEKVSQRGQKSS